MQVSMPSASTSTFMNFSASMSSLSHSITWRSRIAAGSIGTRSSSRSRVRTKPPGCWLRCRGAPISWLRELEGQAQPAIGRVEVQVSKMVGADRLLRPGPDLRREGAEQVLGHAERLADVAQRALRTVADHGGAEGGVVAAVGVEHPLHDDLAALVLEVDVDVGWLAALLRHEALEEEIVARRDRSR